MKHVLLAMMVIQLVLAVTMFATGHLVLGFACLGCGLACLTTAGLRARPQNWTPADTDRIDQQRGSGRR